MILKTCHFSGMHVMTDLKVAALRTFIQYVEKECEITTLISKERAINLRKQHIVHRLNDAISACCAGVGGTCLVIFNSATVAREAVGLLREGGYDNARVRSMYPMDPTKYTVVIPIR